MRAFLLVEDGDAMALAFRLAVEQACIPVVVDRVSNGEEAMEYLYAAQQAPDVVFLDLNMPKTDGWGVLRAMKADDRLCHTAVVVLTSSSRRADKEQAYLLGADQFLVKPATLSGLVDEIEAVYRRFVDGNANSAASGGG
ncbi:MAG TPA: response regulator [Bryobacteraceae bacterium]|jgi:CheY-like chemotaxis protein